MNPLRPNALTMPDVAVWPKTERVADRDDQIPDRQFIGVAKRQRLKVVRRDLQKADVRVAGSLPISSASNVRLSLSVTVILSGTIDHMVIGDDMSLSRIDDDAGTRRPASSIQRPLALRLGSTWMLTTAGESPRRERARTSACRHGLRTSSEIATMATPRRARSKVFMEALICALPRVQTITLSLPGNGLDVDDAFA